VLSLVETYGKKYELNISPNITNNFLVHEGENSIVFYKNEKIMNINSVKIKPFVLMNEIELTNIKLDGLLAGFIPPNIENIKTTYTLANPDRLILKGSGDFGTLSGYINSKMLFIELTPSTLMLKQFPFALSYFKKSDKKYIYEYSL
jgi:hypothetical protein